MMRWVRSPVWDGLWILSGFPIGLAVVALSFWVQPKVIILGATVTLATAHLLSPMVLTWCHPEARRMALARSGKFVVVPLLLLAISVIVGLISHPFDAEDLSFSSVKIFSPAAYRDPLVIMLSIYVLWNTYHFGMQNFGVMSIYRTRGGRFNNQRTWDKAFCLTMIVAATCVPFAPHSWIIGAGAGALFVAGSSTMLIREPRVHFARALFIIVTAAAPLLTFWWGWVAVQIHNAALFPGSRLAEMRWLPYWPFVWAFVLLSINHWLTAIGLAAHIDATANKRSPWWFIGGVMAAGFVIFCLLFVNLGKAWAGGLTASALTFTAGRVGIRLGLGFIHFLYDRWLYKGTSPIWRQNIVSRDLSSTLAILPSFTEQTQRQSPQKLRLRLP